MTELEKNGFDLSQIIEGSPVATFVINKQHQVTHWNRACAQLTGIPAEEMVGSNKQWRGAGYPVPRPTLADLIVDAAFEREAAGYYGTKARRSLTVDDAFEAEDFFPRLGEHGRWLFCTATAIRNAEGEIVGAIETLQDVTERRVAQSALAEKEAFLAQIVDGSSVATLVIDGSHRVTHWNHACEVLTGTMAREVVGTCDPWKAFYSAKRPIMADLILDGAQEGAIDRLYHGRYRPSKVVQGGFEAEDYFPQMGERGRWLFFTGAPLRNASGEIVGAIETLQDITERRRAEEALRESEDRYRRLSVTDSLTGLFNSRHMQEQLAGEMERAGRYDRPLSILVMDADNFKSINDTYGHPVGDLVLQALASVIAASLRRTDSAYRYGGEEFVAILPEATEQAALALAERIRQLFADKQVETDRGTLISCTLSIGVARYRPGETKSEFVSRADQATYQAKRQGKNCVVLAEG